MPRLVAHPMTILFIEESLLQYEEYASAYGGLLADIGQAEEAIKALQHSVERFPEKGFQKYM